MNNKFLSTSSDIEETIIKCPLILSSETPLIEAIQLMSQVRDSCDLTLAIAQSDVNLLNQSEKASCILADKNNKLVGIFTERDIIKSTAMGLSLKSTTLADVMVKNPVTLKKSEFTNIYVVLNLFRQHKIRNLVIVDDHDHIVGLVTPTTVRQLLQAADFLKIRTIGDVMTSEVIQASPTTSILELARLMADYSVSCVVITESDSQPIGVVTERDIVQIRALELDIRGLEADMVMNAPLFCMRPQQSLWEAHQQMQQRCIRRLVVLGDRNQLVGIVTQSSVLYSLNPLEMDETVNSLQGKIYQLELKKVEILEEQKTVLEIQVQERTSKLLQQANSDQLLATLSQKIRNSLDLESILQTTISEIWGYLQTDRVVIYQLEPEWTGKIIAESLAPNIASILNRVIYDPCFAANWIEAYANGRVQIINDLYTSGLTDCHINFLEQQKIRAHLIVPIVYNRQLWGLLCAHECSHPRQWESVEVELLQKLSVQIAIAIQQSQLYQTAQQELLERQKAEINLIKLNEELESRVAERIAELRQINHELVKEIQGRIQAEITLRESEQKFRQLAENLHQVLWMTDIETSKIIYISPAYEEIWGLSCASLYENPKSFIDAIYPDDFQEFMIAVQNKKNGFDIEYRIKKPDGSMRWVHDRAFPLKDATGEVYRVVGIAEDITQRKQFEEEIQKALAKEKELSELKSRFVSMTSHEFRTPLAVISSSAEILRNFGHRLDEESKREHLECIQTYVDHTTRLLDDILLINKAETGNLAFEPAPLDLVSFCQLLTHEIQLSASIHTIVFANNSQSHIIGNFDKKILRQILINLLSNAIKYSPKSAMVNFNLDMTESNVIFSIQDQGIGIPEADQVKLFESFHRAKNVGNIPGTGLGLSIVAKCVDLHKGAIAVNSQIDMGTTFIVTIPLNK